MGKGEWRLGTGEWGMGNGERASNSKSRGTSSENILMVGVAFSMAITGARVMPWRRQERGGKTGLFGKMSARVGKLGQSQF